MCALLVGEDGPLQGSVISLSEKTPLPIGRTEDNNLQEDPLIEEAHAVLTLKEKEVEVRNLAKVHLSKINGAAFDEIGFLLEGDVLQIGSSFFRLNLHEKKVTPMETMPKKEEDSTPKMKGSWKDTIIPKWMLWTAGIAMSFLTLSIFFLTATFEKKRHMQTELEMNIFKKVLNSFPNVEMNWDRKKGVLTLVGNISTWNKYHLLCERLHEIPLSFKKLENIRVNEMILSKLNTFLQEIDCKDAFAKVSDQNRFEVIGSVKSFKEKKRLKKLVKQEFSKDAINIRVKATKI